MATKLTLTIDNTVIESAKKYAKTRGKSLSVIVESYLKFLSSENVSEAGIDSRVAKMIGAIKLRDNYNYKTELGNALTKKYNCVIH